MALSRLLIANRGEIAIRLARTAAELGIETVGVCAEDDVNSLHLRRMNTHVGLRGIGPAAYLDIDQLVSVAVSSGCDSIHPGYGFLSERADFARACADAGLVFVGPAPESLDLLGDKTAARALAQRCDVPTLPGTSSATSLADAEAFFAARGPLMVKALAGGGGRGMRVVMTPGDLAEAFDRCRSEALGAFGDGELYVERLLTSARHIEVQIIGDGTRVIDVGERECTLQRRNQKIIEVAPSPSLSPTLRSAIIEASVRMADSLDYRSLGTFEFLLDADSGDWYFIEANPRIQVEHTVTEAVTGLDLVAIQLRLAGGEYLDDIADIAERRPVSGSAIQLRVTTDRLLIDGSVRPTGGTISGLEWPTGPGVRIDTAAHSGMQTNPRYDSILAKLIVHASGTHADVLSKAARVLDELVIDGVATNVSTLARIVAHPDVISNRISTRFVDDHAHELGENPATPAPSGRPDPAGTAARHGDGGDRLSIGVSGDPLAVFAHPKGPSRPPEAAHRTAQPEEDRRAIDDERTVRSPMPGTIVAVVVEAGSIVRSGEQLLIMEAMKMEHVIVAPYDGVVIAIAVRSGATVGEGDVFCTLDRMIIDGDATSTASEVIDPSAIRPDLAEVHQRQFVTTDEARPEAVAKRRLTGQRTARENIADLCDEGSFNEYGSLVIAAQRRRRSVDDLIAKTPADGMVAGIGSVNGDLVGKDRSQTMVISYDYMVLAGTQGQQNHRKKDRMFELAKQLRTPVVFFTEGGGGRPGDTDGLGVAGLDCMAFALWGQLSGLVPLIGINSGRCFAGNAAILGCCDVIIATDNSSIGMGGPAMIEGGGLGVFHPDEVGPMSVQVPSGVVDISVSDEAEAVAVAQQYLSYFQGSVSPGEAADQRLLRSVIPENRKRVYDVREVIRLLADVGSVLELRSGFGIGMITAFARIEGRPIGIIANNPLHLAGAIDSDGADKAARFLQLCDAYDIPILSLCDTPGMMVGPDVEATALVRHCSRLFVVGGSITVPLMTVVLRKGYGLGAQAMAGGSFKVPLFTIAWPTGEFGGMGLEGAVKLGYRKELEAIEDAVERAATFEVMVARMYEHGKAVSMASHFEIDDVIDPADTRSRIAAALASAPAPPARVGKKRPCIDTW